MLRRERMLARGWTALQSAEATKAQVPRISRSSRRLGKRPAKSHRGFALAASMYALPLPHPFAFSTKWSAPAVPRMEAPVVKPSRAPGKRSELVLNGIQDQTHPRALTQL